MDVAIDPHSPVPLYHQIVECLRYRIATGQLRGGDALPTLREAAHRWGVNLHTVRRAYGELSAAGLVSIRRPQGVTVSAGPTSGDSRIRVAGLQRFLTGISRQARRRFGLNSVQLSVLLRDPPDGSCAAQEEHRATFVECNALQASDYAAQVKSRWSVQVRPWSLESSGDPPPGLLVSTYFHFNEVRARWPRRHADMRFVPVHLDHSLLDSLTVRSDRTRPVRVVLAEQKDDRARQILGDLMGLLPTKRFSVAVQIVKQPGSPLARAKHGPFVLFAPRLWSMLTDQQRSHPRAVQLRYVIEAAALSGLARELGWQERKEKWARAL